MLHTFVICAFGQSPYLEECIDSIRNQSVQSSVIISTSTDNNYIRDIAYKKKIPLHINDHEADIALDWNSAIDVANTEYITIAHQDDIYEKDYVEKVLEAAEKSKQSQIIFTDYYEIRGDSRIYLNTNLMIKRMLLFPLRVHHLQALNCIKRSALAFGNAICCPSVTYNKRIIQVPLFDRGMKSNIDWEAWEKLSKSNGKFCYIAESLVGHRIHDGSTTTSIIRNKERSEEDLAVLKKFWPKYIAHIINKAYKNAERSN